MKIIRSKEFSAEKAWDAKQIAVMNGITVRLHWSDKPYKWHTNEGQEVFVVLYGLVKMLYRVDGIEEESLLEVGDIFYASVGTEHVAHPLCESRILVIESEDSV